jgi:hypothetical protein
VGVLQPLDRIKMHAKFWSYNPMGRDMFEDCKYACSYLFNETFSSSEHAFLIIEGLFEIMA